MNNNQPNPRYKVYIGSHTDTNSCKGITLFDVNTKKNTLIKQAEFKVSNASYLTTSWDRRFLYAITDEGVTAMQILDNGNLRKLNTGSIKGMRGCYLSVTKDNRYLFASGYHDGKITVLRLHEDGSVGEVTENIFHRGPGSVAERIFRPHVRCTRLTPDEKFLCAVDSGLDQVKIYHFNQKNGRLSPCDTLRCQMQTSPRHLIFSRDGRYMYLIKEQGNNITTFSYDGSGKIPIFEKLQTVSTLGKQFNEYNAAIALKFSPDEKLLVCTNAGDHSLGVFARDEETGLLSPLNVLPISGRYPTDVQFFPDGRHLFCCNYDSCSMTFFHLNEKTGNIVMYQQPIPVEQPRCALLVQLP